VELEAFTAVAQGLDHPEGVALAPDGRLVAGGEAGQIYTVDTSTGAVDQRASTGGFLFGVTVDGEGTVYGCDFGRAELLRITIAGEVSCTRVARRRTHSACRTSPRSATTARCT